MVPGRSRATNSRRRRPGRWRGPPTGASGCAAQRARSRPCRGSGRRKPRPSWPMPWRLGRTPEQAGAAASRLTGPVAVKAIVPGLLHKTEAGAVRLGLRGPSAVTRAAAELTRALQAAGQPPEGFLVQRMVTGVAELLVGVVNDPTFGAVVAVGAGGTSAELLGDVAVRLAPLTDRDATQALRELKTFPLLDGWRGTPKADQAALEDLLLRVGILADNHPEIAELDCNPVIAGPDGATIVDVRIRVELPPPSLPLSARRR